MRSCKPSCKNKGCWCSLCAANTQTGVTVQQEANAMFPVKTILLKWIQVSCNNSIAVALIELISKSVLPLTCDQVWQCPHGALQLCSSSWVPPDVLRVPLIETAQSVYVLFNVRHYRFNLRHTEKYTLHLAAVSGLGRLATSKNFKVRNTSRWSHLLFKT